MIDCSEYAECKVSRLLELLRLYLAEVWPVPLRLLCRADFPTRRLTIGKPSCLCFGHINCLTLSPLTILGTNVWSARIRAGLVSRHRG